MTTPAVDTTLKLMSFFSGVGGLDKGFEHAGMQVVGHVEKDKAASAVLAYQWPHVPNFGDITDEAISDLIPAADVWGGGFPCQDLSVAGKRKGLAGERSGLWYTWHRLLRRHRPRWVVIENVPGLLSSNGGRDFAVVLGGLTGRLPAVPAGGWANTGFARGADGWYAVAWRVLDAQYFGVPQQRRRVFIVASLGDGRCAEVLFERKGGGWNPPPRRTAGARPASTPAPSAGQHSSSDSRDTGDGSLIAATLTAGMSSTPGVNPPGRRREDDINLVVTDEEPYTFDWQAGGTGDTSFNGKSRQWVADKPGRARALVANKTLAVFGGNDTSGERDTVPTLTHHAGRYDFESEALVLDSASDDKNAQQPYDGVVGPLMSHQTGGWRTGADEAGAGHVIPVYKDTETVYSFTERGREGGRTLEAREGVMSALTNPGEGGRTQSRQIAARSGVRRLTPRECERLQGFPDDWTAMGATGPQSDSARYRQMGNAICVTVAEWIGRRIVAVERGEH